MHWKEGFLIVTWADFRLHAWQLSQKIAASNRVFDLIVSIARGGLTLSQLISDSLQLPIAAFTIQSYKDLKQESVPHITYGLSSSLKDKKILLIDDVSDSGKTFIRGLSYLEELGALKKDITTASLHFKPHSQYKPDFYYAQTADWIVYPYEARETMEYLLKKWRSEQIKDEEINKRFEEMQFLPEQIKTLIE